MTKLYLSVDVKLKKDGKHYVFDHVCKYHDSILYCAKLAKQDLPRGYLTSTKNYTQMLKKDQALVKGHGEIDEHDVDKIPFAIFETICKWVIKMGNIMVWSFSVMQ